MGNIATLIVLGLVSGIASYGYANLTEDISWGPGFIFGLIIGWYFKKEKLSTTIMFSIVSTLIYYCAVYFTIQTSEVFDDLSIPLFIAGSVGASLFLLTVHFILYRLSFSFILLASLVGGCLGLTFLLPNGELNSYSAGTNFLYLYVCWQTGIALMLGLYEYQKKKLIARIKKALKK